MPASESQDIHSLPSAQAVNKNCCQTQPTPADIHTPKYTQSPLNICTEMHFKGTFHTYKMDCSTQNWLFQRDAVTQSEAVSKMNKK